MKRFVFILTIISSFLIYSCSGDSGKKECKDEKTKTECKDEKVKKECATKTESNSKSVENETTGKPECDEFLKKYDKWADEYIKVYKKSKGNPTDMAVVAEMTKLATEMIAWGQKWQKVETCMKDPSYAKRYVEISKKIQKATE